MKGKERINVPEFVGMDELVDNNRPATNLFLFILKKANEQAIHDGQLTQDYISFPLQELVDIGFYKTKNSARTGFKSGMDALTSLKLKGKINRSKSILEVLFTGARIINNQCIISINQCINWNPIAQPFATVPFCQ